MATTSGMSSAATALLPPVKSVLVYRNGDPFYCGRRFVVNQRQVSTMEAFLNEVTQSIGAPLAVRNLYTPRQGHRVRELQDLQTGSRYVAAGFERFKKLDYQNTGLKKQPVGREGTQAKIIQRPNVSAKWRKFIPVPCIIHVFRNGDLLCPPFRFIIPRSLQQDLEQILSLVTEKVSLRTGAVRRLCSLEGLTVSSPDELETGQCYVAVGTERFKKLPYVELLVSKATERHHPRNRRFESRKAGSGPEDRYSDSALLDSPESDGRRVKSTGDEAVEVAPPQAAQRRTGRERRNEGSNFYARPVRVRKNRRQPRPPVSNGPAHPSVFRRGVRRRREEVRGAKEVQEDENTVTEFPVDQRVAEVVEDEELNERGGQPHNTEQKNEKARVPAGSPINSRPTSVQKRNSDIHNSESNTGVYQRQTDNVMSEAHSERDHPHVVSGNQIQSPGQDSMKQQPVAVNQNAPIDKEDNSARPEEDSESAAKTVEPKPEPKLASSDSRAPSSASHSSGDGSGIRGKNRGILGDKSSQKASNSQKSPQDPPSDVMEQSSCQDEGPVADENGDFIKQQVKSTQ